MTFDTLPTELITQIFLSLPTISSVLALASTCHRFRHTYNSSKRLPILYSAADAEFGPIDDIIQLVTQNDSQPAHLHRTAPVSLPLLQQIIAAGRVAQRYEDIYPLKKWKTDFAARRLLTPTERYTLRRALYRLWLFSRAFHTAGAQPRTCRATPEARRARAQLLAAWPTRQLAEMLDVHAVLRDLVARNLCPSNGKVRHALRKRFPDEVGVGAGGFGFAGSGGAPRRLSCNIHLNYPPPPSMTDYWRGGGAGGGSGWGAYGGSMGRPFPDACGGMEGWGVEGWGDEIAHYYVVEDMMKLDPAQLLHLRDRCPRKAQVEAYVRALGDWFGNNGETFSEAVAAVVRQRGGDMQALRVEVDFGFLGVVVSAAED